MNDLSISPSKYAYLGICPPTSILVERSFSILKKTLAKNRSFSKENVLKYFFCYYNSLEYNEEFELSESSEVETYKDLLN
jgi:hypothetical protein